MPRKDTGNNSIGESQDLDDQNQLGEGAYLINDQILALLKTYAAFSNAHLSRACKRGKLSRSCLSTLNVFGSTQLPIFLCHIGVPTFSLQNN